MYKFVFDEKKQLYELWRKNKKGYYNFLRYVDEKEKIKLEKKKK